LRCCNVAKREPHTVGELAGAMLGRSACIEPV